MQNAIKPQKITHNTPLKCVFKCHCWLQIASKQARNPIPRRWCNGQHSCLPSRVARVESSWSGFDSPATQVIFFASYWKPFAFCNLLRPTAYVCNKANNIINQYWLILHPTIQLMQLNVIWIKVLYNVSWILLTNE